MTKEASEIVPGSRVGSGKGVQKSKAFVHKALEQWLLLGRQGHGASLGVVGAWLTYKLFSAFRVLPVKDPRSILVAHYSASPLNLLPMLLRLHPTRGSQPGL